MDEGYRNLYAYLLKDSTPSNSFLNQEAAEQEIQQKRAHDNFTLKVAQGNK